jgi:hypothetical protein
MPFSYERRHFLCVLIMLSFKYEGTVRKEVLLVEDDRLWFPLGRVYVEYFNSSLSCRHELRPGFIYAEITLSWTIDLWVPVRARNLFSELNH